MDDDFTMPEDLRKTERIEMRTKKTIEKLKNTTEENLDDPKVEEYQQKIDEDNIKLAKLSENITEFKFYSDNGPS